MWVGLDASVTRDSTAIVACAFDGASKRVRLVWHRVFRPSPQDPLDFENTIEQTLFELRDRFHVREVYYDPYQLVSVAQRLRHRGVRMSEFTQTVSNLTEASSNLYELIKGRNLWVYQDPDMRLAVSRAVALETSRGWRITKEKTSHKIDVVVALAQAALGAVRGGQPAEPSHLTYIKQLAARINGNEAAPETGDPTPWHAAPHEIDEVRADGEARQAVHNAQQSQVAGLVVACSCGSVTTHHEVTCAISRAAARQLMGSVPG